MTPRLSTGSPVALALAAGLAGACAPGPKSPSVLLVTLDTTRADALSCYGGPGASTPNLDRLAGEGVLYERAYTSAPLTMPAHASLLTGLYPVRHGVRTNGLFTLPASADTLAERARSAGFQTAAFIGSVVLDGAFGLQQGFEVYAGPAREGAGQEAERAAPDIVDDALAWLGGRDAKRPFFLWLHFYDPHTPYAPPSDLAGDTRHASYLGEVTWVDRELSRVLDALRAEGALADTLIVAVGDHGEGFGEHDERGHSVHCYDTTLRVPLIVRWPDGWRAGERSREIVSIVDLFPTISNALGLGASDDVDGRDIRDAGGAEEGDGVYFESYYGYLSFAWAPITGWIDEEGKYVHGTTPSFYALADDPGETTDRSADPDVDLERYRRSIGILAERATLAASASNPDQSLIADLESLGYAGVGSVPGDIPHPLAPTGLPDPASMDGPYQETLTAVELARAGEVEEALAIFERVLELNPKNPFLLEQIAICQVHLERVEDAIVSLRRLLRDAPTTAPSIWHKLALCLRSTGDNQGAIDALEQALAYAPDRPRFLREMIATLQLAGRGDEATPYRKRLSEVESGG